MEIMESDGIEPKVIRAGNDNLFRSEIFSNTVATLINHDIEIYNTTGAVGAARACQLYKGDFEHFGKIIMENDFVMLFKPSESQQDYKAAYIRWKNELKQLLKNK